MIFIQQEKDIKKQQKMVTELRFINAIEFDDQTMHGERLPVPILNLLVF